MAERRVQVRELDVPSLSSVTPTASPVETYVRPVQEEFQPSALSEFVSAIAPAIQEESEQKLKQRLDRERKIEAGIFKNQLNQVYQHAVQVGTNLSKDYDNNKDIYLNFRDDNEGTAAEKLLAIRKQNIDDNVSAMEREGVDELLVQAFKNDMQMIDTAFMKDVYLKDKETEHEKQVYGSFGNSIINILDTKLERANKLAQINQLYLGFVDANAGNHTKALDYIWGIAEERSRSSADNALVDWLKSPMSSAKGQPAQWSVAKRVKQRGVIEARAIAQANASKSALKKKQTQESLATKAASAYANGNMGELATDRDTILGTGDTVRHKPEDYIPHFENEFASEVIDIQNMAADDDTKKELITTANRKRFKFYSTYNLMPPQLSQAVNNGRTLLTMGDLTDPTNVAKAEQMYEQLNMADAYSGGGITTTALKGEDATRFRHLQVLVNGGYDFTSALGKVQGKIYDGRSVKIEDQETKDFYKTWWKLPWTTETEVKARNIGLITEDVRKLTEALIQTEAGIDPDQAKKTAMELVTKDYKFVTNSDGSVTAVRIESNALTDALNVQQIEQGMLDVQNDATLRSLINPILGTEDRVIPASRFGAGSIESGFNVYIIPTGNANQLYLYAKPSDEDQEGTQTMLLGTVNIWDFNANRIQSLKDQIIQKYQKAVESEQLSSVTSTTPSLQPGGAAGEDDFTTTIANALSSVGNAIIGTAQASELPPADMSQAGVFIDETAPEAAPTVPVTEVQAEEVTSISPSERRIAEAQAKLGMRKEDTDRMLEELDSKRKARIPIPRRRPTQQEIEEANKLTTFESFIEEAKNISASVVNKLVELGEDVAGTPDALSMLIKDVGVKNTLGVPLNRRTQTVKDLKSSTVETLRRLARKAIARKRMNITWDDYGVDSNGIEIKSIIGGGKKNKEAAAFYPRNASGMLRLFSTLMVDPALDAALTIGQASLKRNEKGEIILTDTYDAEKFMRGSASKGAYGAARDFLGKEGRLSLEKSGDTKIKFEVNLGKL
jgi:hypothetical protein